MTKFIRRRGVSALSQSVEKTVFKHKHKEKEKVEFLHSGSSILNLMLSGRVNGGWARGRVVNIVGDGSTGKTLLALELAAWFYYYVMTSKSKLFPKVKRVKIIYYNAEEVMDFPIAEMYGKGFEKAIDWRPKKGKPKTAEGFGRDVGRELMAHKEGDAVLYIEDSIDALNPEAASKRFDKAAKEDKPEESKSYAETASYFSQSFFKNLVSKVSGKDFTIVLISQVREKMGVVFGRKQYRIGGKSLDFYTHQVVWLAVRERLTRTIAKKKRHYGIAVSAYLDRSKVSKPFGSAEFDILWGYGVDDYGGLIDFVMPEVSSQTRAAWIRKMERDRSVYLDFQRKAQMMWDRIEKKTRPNRVRKYGPIDTDYRKL